MVWWVVVSYVVGGWLGGWCCLILGRLFVDWYCVCDVVGFGCGVVVVGCLVTWWGCVFVVWVLLRVVGCWLLLGFGYCTRVC